MHSPRSQSLKRKSVRRRVGLNSSHSQTKALSLLRWRARLNQMPNQCSATATVHAVRCSRFEKTATFCRWGRRWALLARGRWRHASTVGYGMRFDCVLRQNQRKTAWSIFTSGVYDVTVRSRLFFEKSRTSPHLPVQSRNENAVVYLHPVCPRFARTSWRRLL